MMRFGVIKQAMLSAAAICAVAACTSGPSDSAIETLTRQPAKPEQRVAQQRLLLPQGQPAASQLTFATPDEAVKALWQACDAKDREAMKKIFGPVSKDFESGDAVADENDFEAFVAATSERAELETRDENTFILRLGKDNWPFAIPITKTNDGKWYFDTLAGETEILARRIGSNELEAISVCREYVDAQREYATVDRDGSGVLKYAQRLKSKPGAKDGLYWQSEDGGSSPFGPFIAEAAEEGYPPISGSRANPTAYRGYFFHVIREQGPSAPGGAYGYVINGNMIAGFALVAYPAEYGKSGIMTFIVSHNGTVHQQDLGRNTEKIAREIKVYNPDKAWEAVKD